MQTPNRHSLVGREREVSRLEGLLAGVRAGGSASLLIVGEPGVGKSALVERLVAAATDFRVVRAVGVEGEIDLPYAALHQLCRSLVGSIDALPQPQAAALQVAFGLASGEVRDRYLVGLAVLSLLSEAAMSRPLLCVVDDAQWLDRASIDAMAFVARRLRADSVGLVIASRTSVDELRDLPTLELAGLDTADARALLDVVVMGRLDGPVRERFLAETRGNPLALLELPHTLTPAEAASGILHKKGGSLTARIEDSFRQRLEQLPAETQQILLLAAAEPVGDPLLLMRAASRLGLPVEAADAAVDAGLLEVRQRWAFRHPLVRSAAYRLAGEADRRAAHGVLAEVTDTDVDADRKAWHRAQATAVPDEEVAAALEQTAVRAQARGGLAAAGAFLERAAQLTPDATTRVERALAAAEMLFEAGAIDAVEELLRAIEASGLTELQAARAQRVRAEVSLSRGAGNPSRIVLQLLEAAAQLKRFDPAHGQTVQLRALSQGLRLGPDVISALAATLDSTPIADQPSPVELMLRGYGQLLAEGFPAGTDLARKAVVTLRDAPDVHESDLDILDLIGGTAWALWDLDSGEVVARRGVELIRRVGALSRLPDQLGFRAVFKAFAGDFDAAEVLLAEAEAISEAIGQRYDLDRSFLDAVCCKCDEALIRIDAHERRGARGEFEYDSHRAAALNGAGRYELALECAQRACDTHPAGGMGAALLELIEAATRCAMDERAQAALGSLLPRTQLSGTDWALGLEARCRALVSDDDAAEPFYREALERLERSGARPDLARAQLLYGEWLRRCGRRRDAREQLRVALELFEAIGMPGFAERARRELVATGESARKRTEETRADLTAQEAQIVRFAAQGLTNVEIGAQLYLSPRTVEWHLRHVFPKLGITSRRELWKVSVAAVGPHEAN